jgi:DNA (cytosine-5)-methyltransferase 1
MVIEIGYRAVHVTKNLKFIDLFAGIGGIRLGIESSLGGECVFSSEWDWFAQNTYEANFGERPDGDITHISPHDIPDHDLLLAGFPCQAFSICGDMKGVFGHTGNAFLHY